MDYTQLFQLEFWQRVFTDNIFSTQFLANLLDILIVWFIIYKAIKMVQGTRAVQLAKGVALFFIARVVAEVIGLTTITWLMNQVITYGVIAGIIIFQPEVRKALEQLGRTANIKTKQDTASEEIVEAYEKAVEYMSKRKIGALITIERKRSLSEYISTGIPLDADISHELLINIFIPNTPLHDGAVIIRDNKVLVACAYLPLTENPTIPKEFGTRHRAGIGVSEVSDALTIIVSEETGGISVTKDNEFLTDLSLRQLNSILTQAFVKEDDEKEKNLFRIVENSLFKKKREDE